jgi:hypothetical protein
VITHYCHIRNYNINADGNVLFAGRQPLSEFVELAYHNIGLDYPKFYKMDNQSKLGILGVEALIGKRFLSKEFAAEKIAVVLSNAHGSQDTDIRFQESVQSVASPSLFVYTLPNIVIGEICIRHKIKGENAFFVTPKFDSALLAEYVESVMQSGTELCIAGWVDALGEQHDVFLYLLEKNAQSGMIHSAQSLEELYNSAPWNN